MEALRVVLENIQPDDEIDGYTISCFFSPIKHIDTIIKKGTPYILLLNICSKMT